MEDIPNILGTTYTIVHYNMWQKPKINKQTNKYVVLKNQKFSTQYSAVCRLLFEFRIK